MKRALPLLAAGILLSACGATRHALGSSVIDYRPHVPKSSVTPLANQREARANREAARLLSRIPLPSGAVRLPAPAPTDRLAQSALGVSVVQMTADRYSIWRVPMSGQAVIAFEKRHKLPGFHEQGLGSSPDGWGGEEFDGRIVNGSASRAVAVTVVPDGSQTRVRLDAGVGWIYPRSPQEVLPAGVREIDIRDETVSRRVTDAGQVARIVRWFDSLNVAQPGPSVGCMVTAASQATFVFRSASGARLAGAVVPSGPANNCDSIRFSVGGKRQTPLIDATMGKNAFVFRVERLLGLKFPCRLPKFCR